MILSPIFFLHGFLGDFNELDSLFKQLPYNVIGLNWMRFVDTKTMYNLADIAKDICAYIRVLGYSSVMVYGYSMGGRLAMQCACEDPDLVKVLYLESAHFGYDNDIQKNKLYQEFISRMKMFNNLSFEQFLGDWYNQDLFKLTKKYLCSSDIKKKLRLDYVKVRELMTNLHVSKQPYFVTLLGALEVPIYYVAGELDTKYSNHAIEVSKIITNFNYTIVSNADHNVHVSNAGGLKKVFLSGF
jgi:2-succinyl-6-hydroxy-2,4-cyclohexadiene-1-carboxylate synthase